MRRRRLACVRSRLKPLPWGGGGSGRVGGRRDGRDVYIRASIIIGPAVFAQRLRREGIVVFVYGDGDAADGRGRAGEEKALRNTAIWCRKRGPCPWEDYTCANRIFVFQGLVSNPKRIAEVLVPFIYIYIYTSTDDCQKLQSDLDSCAVYFERSGLSLNLA